MSKKAREISGPEPEVQGRRKGGWLLLARRKAPWKKNGGESEPCSEIC
jgi:hypothetical protein